MATSIPAIGTPRGWQDDRVTAEQTNQIDTGFMHAIDGHAVDGLDHTVDRAIAKSLGVTVLESQKATGSGGGMLIEGQLAPEPFTYRRDDGVTCDMATGLPVSADDERVWAVRFEHACDWWMWVSSTDGLTSAHNPEEARAFTRTQANIVADMNPGREVVRHPAHPEPTRIEGELTFKADGTVTGDLGPAVPIITSQAEADALFGPGRMKFHDGPTNGGGKLIISVGDKSVEVPVNGSKEQLAEAITNAVREATDVGKPVTLTAVQDAIGAMRAAFEDEREIRVLGTDWFGHITDVQIDGGNARPMSCRFKAKTKSRSTRLAKWDWYEAGHLEVVEHAKPRSFKVGDRVRVAKHCIPSQIGRTGTIEGTREEPGPAFFDPKNLFECLVKADPRASYDWGAAFYDFAELEHLDAVQSAPMPNAEPGPMPTHLLGTPKDMAEAKDLLVAAQPDIGDPSRLDVAIGHELDVIGEKEGRCRGGFHDLEDDASYRERIREARPKKKESTWEYVRSDLEIAIQDEAKRPPEGVSEEAFRAHLVGVVEKPRGSDVSAAKLRSVAAYCRANPSAFTAHGYRMPRTQYGKEHPLERAKAVAPPPRPKRAQRVQIWRP